VTVFAGDVIAAVDINRRVGYTSATSDGSATSGTTEQVVDTVTCTVISGRSYLVEAFFPYTGTVVADGFFVLLREGITTAGTQLTYQTATISQTVRVEAFRPAVLWTASSTGSQSFCVCVRRNSGTGTLTPRGSGGQVRWLRVTYDD
jgi:hypothetical protein